MAEAEEQLRWIEERIARQDEFEHTVLSSSAFTREQKDVRLLATRRVTLSQIRDSIEAYRSWERKHEAIAATHSLGDEETEVGSQSVARSLPAVSAQRPARIQHSHEWDEPCTLSCPWRQALINEVTKEADHGTRTE